MELDGRLDHSALDRDLERDLETATSGRRSVRLGWGRVYDRPCRTAALIARLLVLGGWGGGPKSARGIHEWTSSVSLARSREARPVS